MAPPAKATSSPGKTAGKKRAPRSSPPPSLEERLAAVRALAALPLAQREGRAPARARREREREVRADCRDVLSSGSSAESPDVLLAALDDHPTVARALPARVSQRLDVDRDRLGASRWDPAAAPPRTALHAFERDPRWADVARRLLAYPALADDARHLLSMIARR